MNTKSITKVLAAFLAFTLSFTNVAILGSYMDKTYAASVDLEEQSTNVNKAEVEFDAYFEEEGENVHSKIIDIAEDNCKLHFSIKVDEGYIEDAFIKINNANFKVQETDEELSVIQSISSENNEITLNQINKGELVVLEVPIKADTDSNFDAKDLSKVASVVLSGTYVNNKGKDSKIEKTIEVQTIIDGTVQGELTSSVSKYVTFDVNGNKGVILQNLVNLKLADNKLPIKSTELEIEIPIINNIEPKTITLSAKSLMMNNEIEGRVFEKDKDYTCENGKVILKLENDENLSKISSDAKDEVILTCIYDETAMVEEATLNLNANAKVNYYGKEMKELALDCSEEVVLKEQIGDIVTLDIDLSEENLYTGYMLKENGKNTEFVSKLNVNVGYSELVDKISFKDSTSYLDEKGNKYPSNAIYTYTKVSKENFVGILGEDGYINICGKDGNVIATLNKDNLEYKFENEEKEITFETSKPQTEGILEIENGRGIKSLEYTKNDESKFTAYSVNLEADILKDNTKIISGQVSKEIKLNDTTTKAELSISKQNISTVVTNENVELRVTLDTNDASTSLYKAPKVKIVLPSYITDIKVENVKLLYEKDLKLSGAKMYRNAEGNIVIEVELKGEQTEYNESAVAKGATLVMNSDITVDALTPAKTDTIYLYVENGNETIKESAEIKYIAPSGLVAVNQISGYNDKNEKTISISGKKEVGEIARKSDAKVAQVDMTVINNYDYNIENVKLLGRIPFEGNKKIKTNEDLGSTFTAKIVSEVKAKTGVQDENITVYYNEDGNASRNISDESGWKTKENIDLSKAKSFMIVLNDYALNAGETISFTYNIEIPAGLEYNEEAYGVFAVYYTRQSEIQTMSIANIQTASMYESSIESGEVGLTTGEGLALELLLSAKIGDTLLGNNADVIERQEITYTVAVTNKAKTKAQNINIEVAIPSRTYYVDAGKVDTSNRKTITLTISEIEPNQTKNVEFVLKTKSYTEVDYNIDDMKVTNDKDGTQRDLNEEEKKAIIESLDAKNRINVKAVVKSEGEEIFSSNECVNMITSATKSPTISIKVSDNSSNEMFVGDKTSLMASITKNVSTLHNVLVTCTLPDEIIYVEGGSYDEKTRTVTWTFDEMNSTKMVTLKIEAGNLAEGEYSKEIPIVFKAQCEETERQFTNTPYMAIIYDQGFKLTQTSSLSDGYISAGEEISYEITLTNLTPSSSKCTLKDKLPSELKYVKCYYTQNGNKSTFEGSASSIANINLTLNANETLKIYVVAKGGKVDKDTEVVNEVSLKSTRIDNLSAEPLKHILLGENGSEVDPGDQDTPEKETYRISGTAWLDDNKDGRKDSNEKLLSGIKTRLIDAVEGITIAETTTNENGVYTFLNVESGKYIVVFEYDIKNYDLTVYQADGVDDSQNSDAINMTLKINDALTKVAATNTINLNTNMYNIDLGLVTSPKFDLELEKTISLVQVSNQKGTSGYNFKNTETAKVEIEEKYMAGSVVAVTYNFKVKNTGAVSGYVNKIVDYKSKEMNFNSTLNPEWYQDESGYVYNTTLMGTEIKPGEEVELSLILTKTMTNENTGLTNNSAEIEEAANDLGLADIDSTPGNKATAEDDYGSADVIITVKTGGILFYGGILLAVLGIFALGAYEINKRVLRRI